MFVRQINRPLDEPSILFAGDYVGSSYFDSPPISRALATHIDEAEAAFVNFEAPLDTGTPTEKHGPILTQGETEPSTVAEMGFDSVTLANNHVMDHGEAGLNATIEACREAGLETLGTGRDAFAAAEPTVVTVDGTDVAVLNGCEKEFGIAGPSQPGAAWIADIKFENAVDRAVDEYDVVVLVAHGGIEFVPLPPPSWQRRLRSFVDRGVDAVVGHHPHVALPWEWYEGAPIVYSLGNFVFYDESRPETQWTYLVDIGISRGEIRRFGIRIVETADGIVQPVTGKTSANYWAHLEGISNLVEQSVSHPGYWQAIADRIFINRYHGRLEDYGNGRLSSGLRHPVYETDRITRGIFSGSERTRSQQLALLNYVRSDCHRDVIETALGLETGAIEDRRTPEIQEEIDTWLGQVDSRSNWGNRRRVKWYLEKAMDRLIPN